MTVSPPLAAARWLLAIAALALVWASAGAAPAPTDPSQSFFDQTFGDYSEELANARTQGKQGLLLMFEMEGCPYCEQMKKTVLNRPEVQAYFRKHFLIFPVDIEGSVEVTDFAGQTKTEKDFATKDNRVRATPTFAFFGLDGKLLAKYAGATDSVQEFLWLGEYVVGGQYQEVPFPTYRRERERGSDAKPGAKPGAAG